MGSGIDKEKGAEKVHKPKIDKNTLLNFSQVFGVRVHIKLALYKLNILGA